MKNVELKRCPFCGGEAKAFATTNIGFVCGVKCSKCGMKIHGVDDNDAAERWNTRPGEDEAYNRGLRNGFENAISLGKRPRIGYFNENQRTECIGKEIQAGQTDTGGPKVY